MKKFLAIALALVMAVGLAACTKPSNNGNTPAPDNQGSDLAGTYDITVWVADKAVELTKTQIDKFNTSNTDGIKFNATIQPVSEADAGTNMITDVEAGGDLYCFAQDQFARLVQAGALARCV